MVGCILQVLPVLLAANLILSEGQAICHKAVSGVIDSPLNLTTSFDGGNVKDVTWKLEIHGIEYRVAKIKNGTLVDSYGDGYKQFCNGTVLGIKKLMETYCGVYTADVTYLDNRVEEEKINVTWVEGIKNQRPYTMYVTASAAITVLSESALMLWISWKKEDKTEKEDKERSR